MKKVPAIVVGWIVVLVGGAIAQDSELPAEARKRLSHQVGRWSVRSEMLDRNGNVVRTVQGTEDAGYLIQDRVLEMTTDFPELGIHSKAWIFYSMPEKKFYLTSVDAAGSFWVLSGSLDEYVLTSEPRQQPNGGSLTIRFTHYDIEPNSFQALMEFSTDQGKTWQKRLRQSLTRAQDQ